MGLMPYICVCYGVSGVYRWDIVVLLLLVVVALVKRVHIGEGKMTQAVWKY